VLEIWSSDPRPEKSDSVANGSQALHTYGQSIKDARKSREKLTPPPCPQNFRTGLTPLDHVDTPKISKNPMFLIQKSADVRI